MYDVVGVLRDCWLMMFSTQREGRSLLIEFSEQFVAVKGLGFRKSAWKYGMADVD